MCGALSHRIVSLVGIGPRDPKLKTLKAIRIIKNANLLLYHRLVSDDELNFAGLDA